MATDKLSVATINNAKPASKPYKMADGGGLTLLIKPNGAKYWRFRFRFGGKENTLGFGVFPDVPLAEARERRDKAKATLRAGRNPAHGSSVAIGDSFAEVAEAWFKVNVSDEPGRKAWTNGHARTVRSRLDRDVLPRLGPVAIASLKPSDALTACRLVEARGAYESAQRIKTIIGQVMRFGVAIGKADRDITADLAGALVNPKVVHMAAITDPKEIGGLLRSIDGYAGSSVVRAALRLAPLVFVRPGELRSAEWHEIDLERALWAIPAEKMKMRREHLVPLSRQAVQVLREVQPETGKGRYVFPSPRSRTRPLSNNALLAALRRMGFEPGEMTVHGFRTMASTNLNELGYESDWIEMQLAHVSGNVRSAYNRAKWLKERTMMMQEWADWLDERRRLV